MAVAVLAGLAPAAEGGAQQPPPCKQILCAPSLTLEPTLNHSHLFGGPIVRSLSTGAVQGLPPQNNLELIVLFGIPTFVPHLSLIVSTQWLPTATTAANPYTEYTAGELGQPVRAPGLSITMGGAYDVLTPANTAGWLTLTPYLGDNFSPAARPDDASAFTHKLDVGLTAQIHALSWLPAHVWARNVGVIALLDYRATGLPHAGDDVPRGQRVFLTSARPATLIAGLSIPVAPLEGTP